MNPEENFRITKEEEKNAFLGTGRDTNALTLADWVPFDPMIGIQDGKNKIFKLHHKPIEKTIAVWSIGLRQVLGQDFEIKQNTIIFKEPPRYGDNAFAQYISICEKGDQP